MMYLKLGPPAALVNDLWGRKW